jgi:signal transduction histidine kinase
MRVVMSPEAQSQLAEEYEALLEQYFEGVGEAALEYAYELGREALADGLSVLDMARLHHATLLKVMPARSIGHDTLRMADRILIETLMPFEMILRGFRESNAARQASEERYRELFEKVHDRLEATTRRIAHALHDEAGQLLASAYLALAEAARDLPSEQRERVDRVSGLLDQVTEQLRHLSHELRPVILDDLGLVPALEFLAQGIARRSGLVISIESAFDERLPPQLEIALYRIFQEALVNVGKHAHATRVAIALERTSTVVRGSIEDDGIGMRTDVPGTPGRGLGLIGIGERLAALGGTLSIVSNGSRLPAGGSDDDDAHGGTLIEIAIPIAWTGRLVS